MSMELQELNLFTTVKHSVFLEPRIGSKGDINHTEVIYYLALAIQKELTLTEIAFTDVYFLPHFNKPFNFILTAILKAVGLDYDRAAKSRQV